MNRERRERRERRGGLRKIVDDRLAEGLPDGPAIDRLVALAEVLVDGVIDVVDAFLDAGEVAIQPRLRERPEGEEQLHATLMGPIDKFLERLVQRFEVAIPIPSGREYGDDSASNAPAAAGADQPDPLTPDP